MFISEYVDINMFISEYVDINMFISEYVDKNVHSLFSHSKGIFLSTIKL